MTRRANTDADFWRKVDSSGGPDACWPWLAGRTTQGYGSFVIRRQWWRAHRYALTLATGPIPSDREACHTCDNPPCCNPRHLYAGTRSQNVRDAIDRGLFSPGAQIGIANPQSKFTPDDIRAIRAVHPGESLRSIARRFGTTHRNISLIVRRETWADVP